MKTKFEKVFVRSVNPSYVLVEQQKEDDVPERIKNIINSMAPAANAVNLNSFNYANASVLDALHGNQLGTRVVNLQSQYNSFMDKFRNPLQNITKYINSAANSVSVGEAAESDSSDDLTDNDSQSDRPPDNDNQAEVTDEVKEKIKEHQDLVNEAVGHEVFNDIKVIGNTFASDIFKSQMQEFSDILGQSSTNNTMGLSDAQLAVIDAYNKNVELFEQSHGAIYNEKINSAAEEANAILFDQDSKSVSEQSVMPFKKFVNLSEADRLSELIGRGVKAVRRVASVGDDVLDYMGVAPVYKFFFGFYALALLPSLLQLVLNKLPDIVSKLLFPIASMTSIIIVVGQPQGIDPAKDVDKYVRGTVEFLIKPLKSIINTMLLFANPGGKLGFIRRMVGKK